MNILLTGASGYIGGALVSVLLENGNNVANIGRAIHQDNRVINYTLVDDYIDVMKSYKPDVIIHLAASFDNKNIDSIIDINVKLPLKLLEANAETVRVRFLYIGSYWSFGDKALPNIPIDLYSSAKKSFESFMEYYRTYKSIDCINIVLFGTYGESDNRGKLLDYLIECAQKKQLVSLTEGNQRLNLVNILDVVTEIYKLMKLSNTFSNYFITSDKEYTPRDLVSLISKYITIDVDFGAKEYRDVEVMRPIYPTSFKKIMIQDKLEKYISQYFEVYDEEN